MKNILIVNGAKEFGHSKGELNDTFAKITQAQLIELGYQVQVTRIEDGYNPEQEVAKIEWADVLIYQMPGWWMGAPWTMKKYIDEVFTQGQGRLYANDGRTRTDESKKYGSGGLVQGKHYMLSLTWNAPEEAFTDPQQFFHGVGVDGVYLPFHKANQFLGMQPLDTFIAFNVIKEPNVEQNISQLKAHLNSIFKH